MAKTILVPIDFRVASLNTLRLALESFPGEKLRVILIYSLHLDNSITDLLFHSPSKTINGVLTPEFKEALEILKNRFRDQLQFVSIKLFYGNNQGFLKNFVNANRIDTIVIPKSYRFQRTNRAFDPTPLLRKMNVELVEVDWHHNYTQTQQEQLLALFN